MLQTNIIVRMWTLNDKYVIQVFEHRIDLTICVFYLKSVFLLYYAVYVRKYITWLEAIKTLLSFS